MTITLTRREVAAAIGGAATCPVVVRGQQAMPVVGVLRPASTDTDSEQLRAFRAGLKEFGYVDGENVTIGYRWADGRYDRLPELAFDLARRNVAVIVAAGTTAAAFAAKAATTSIPVLFIAADDPVKLGLVASLARPEGNVTGVNFFSAELGGKRLELLRELVPNAARIALLVNPTNATSTDAVVKDVKAAASSMRLTIEVFHASTSREIDTAFARMAGSRPDALLVSADPFLGSRRVQLVVLTVHHSIRAIFTRRAIVEAGGLMSYGASNTDAYRQVGLYTGRILKGAKPADLPVVQSSKFELVINAQTARTLGITVPPTLLATADEVIE
jgi:putative ABC transport system substrate-binding protein